MTTRGTGLLEAMDERRADACALTAAGVLALVLFVSWNKHDWPAWPLFALVLTVPCALWFVRRERAVVNWPGAFSALAGVVVGGLMGLLVGGMRTGLESAERTLAMSALIPTLAAGPLIVCAWTRARPAFGLGSAGGLAIVGFVALRFCSAFSTPLAPVETGRIVLLGGLIVLAVVPTLWSLVRPCKPTVPSVLSAMGLLLLAYVGTSALLQRWATVKLTDPATYIHLQATKEDTQDPFAVGFANGLLALTIQQADLRTLDDHRTALIVAGDRTLDLSGEFYRPSAADEHGTPQPLSDLVASRWIRLDQVGTAARPLTKEPRVVLAESVHHGARTLAWPGAWGWFVAAVAAVCMVGRRRCAGHLALTVAVTLGLLALGLWRT